MKALTIRTLFMGQKSKTIRVELDGIRSFKQLIDENHHELLPGLSEPSVFLDDRFASWENLNSAVLDDFNASYDFSAFWNRGTERHPIHLIDKVQGTVEAEIIIGTGGFRIDDSIAFFLIEKYRQTFDTISIQESGQALEETQLFRFLEEVLSETDSHILVDSFSRRTAEHRIGTFVKQLIPSALWMEMKTANLEYYRRFIVHFANQVFTLDYCVEHSNLDNQNVLQDVCRGWINDFLYRVQNLMLVLLNIPEIFLKSIRPGSDLKSIGIDELPETERANYYKNRIANKAIQEVYREILKHVPIENYQEYIEYCETNDFADINVRRIVYTFRILYNKLKHTSNVWIIKSRDEEGITKRRMEDIDRQIEVLTNTSHPSREGIESEIRKLEFRKEFIDNARSANGHLDFDDPKFKHHNGILVAGATNTTFRITFYDLELCLKLLIGILYMLNKANAHPAAQAAF